jgi:PAS domain S-box-containing protein
MKHRAITFETFESHPRIGRLIEHDAQLLIDRWLDRVAVVRPEARNGQSREMSEKLPEFLQALGRRLLGTERGAEGLHRLFASDRGCCCWRNRWQITDVVRDFQMLRLVVLERLEEAFGGPLELRELMAVGVLLDEAIAAAVAAYDANREAHLSEREERLRAALEASEMGTFRWTIPDDRLEWDESLARIFDIPPERAPKNHQGFLGLVSPADCARVAAHIERSLKDHTELDIEYCVVRSDGSVHWIRTKGKTIFDAAGRPLYMTGACTDITARKAAEEELQMLNESLERQIAERTLVAEQRAAQLRALAAELTQTEQRERRRLAQILHDHLQQLLVAAKLNIGLLRGRTKDAHLLETLLQADDLLKDAISASRSLAVELSPPILYEGGLSPALEWLARWMHEKHGLTVDLQIDPAAEPVAEELRIVLFRAVRELLFNVVKHAQTDRARVEVSRVTGDQVQIVVADTGVGFEPRASETPLHGFGLSNIRERMEFLGGRLEMESTPGQGTRMRLIAPQSWADEIAVEPALPSPVSQQPQHIVPRRLQKQRGSGERVRVLLVDDQRMLRAGLARLLQDQPDIEVVGEAADGPTAIELAHTLQPQVVVMDITMPGMSGIEAARRITREHPDIKVIGLSLHEQEEMARAMLEAGASAYLTKGGPTEDLVAAIRSASQLSRRK